MILQSKILKYSIFVCSIAILLAACKEDNAVTKIDDLSDIRERGVLRVLTLETAFSYYVDKHDKECGLDYDMARNFADYLGLEFELILADNHDDLVDRLERGEGDVAAYRLQLTKKNKGSLKFTNRKDYSNMVLVQKRGSDRISDITELVGKRVWTQRGSKFAKRLKDINNELGGGLIIEYLPDSISVNDMVYMVSSGEIKYCIADEDMAKLLSKKLVNIECAVKVGFNQPKAWAVNKASDSLLYELNTWLSEIKGTKFEKRLINKYVYHNTYINSYKLTIPKGSISPYDVIFQRYAPSINWDWRMLASLAWNESHFNVFAVSSQGAQGMMQMMPRTAAKYGLVGDDIHDPDKSIAAGVRYLKFLDRQFRSIEDGEERIKFILAGYNAGPGHVLDAMALAKKYGSDPHKWEGNVEEWLIKKSEPEYYKDPVCRCGFYRAKYTIRYVKDVYKKYDQYVARSNHNEIEKH